MPQYDKYGHVKLGRVGLGSSLDTFIIHHGKAYLKNAEDSNKFYEPIIGTMDSVTSIFPADAGISSFNGEQ